MNEPRGPTAIPKTTPTPTLRLRLAATLGVCALLALVPTASSQDGCSADGMNAQCTEFGSITMESQRDIRGDPIDMTATITLNTAYSDQAARWLLFSVRNVEADGSNPVTVKLTRFSSAYGEILTTRVENPSANELNLWVDTLDIPVGTPISIDLRVGATDRGAFKLETLVMAFDRGYAPVKDSLGNDASLFSFTLLGVNKETGDVSADSGGLLDGNKLPALGFVPILAALAAVALIARRRLA